MIAFQFRTDLDPVAVYAAIVATLGFAATIWQWLRTGPRLTVELTPNMVMFPSPKKDEYVVIRIYNRGTRATTVQAIGFKTYKNSWSRLRGKPSQAFVIPQPTSTPLPANIEAGNYLTAMVAQTSELVSLSRNQVVLVEVAYSDSDKSIWRRLNPIPDVPVSKR